MAIVAAEDHQRALKIDLATTWWSTRLYLMATLAERLTQARRILIVDTRTVPSVPALARAPVAASPPPREERFVGQLSTSCILTTIGPKVPGTGHLRALAPAPYNQVTTSS